MVLCSHIKKRGQAAKGRTLLEKLAIAGQYDMNYGWDYLLINGGEGANKNLPHHFGTMVSKDLGIVCIKAEKMLGFEERKFVWQHSNIQLWFLLRFHTSYQNRQNTWNFQLFFCQNSKILWGLTKYLLDFRDSLR